MPLSDSLGLAKRALRYRSLPTARLIQANMPYQPAPLRPDGPRVRCDEIDLSVDPQRESLYIEGLRYVHPLVRSGGGRFERNEQGQLEFRHGAVRIVPETVDDLAILNEVFGKRIYRFEADEKPFVLDIGLNVGVAALYFAEVLGLDVLGYEPFPQTFEAAVRNVERSGLGKRITVRKQGVGRADARTTAEYDHATRGSNGLEGNFHAGRTGPGERTEVEIIDAVNAVKEAARLAKGRPILAKIDCEGAEYDIVDRLAEAGKLTELAWVVLEYHTFLPGQDSERLVARFREVGFAIQQLWSDGPVGGLFAFRPGEQDRSGTPLP